MNKIIQEYVKSRQNSNTSPKLIIKQVSCSVDNTDQKSDELQQISVTEDGIGESQ